MTDVEIMAAIERLTALLPDVPVHRQEFAKSLIHQYGTKGFVSEKQAWWVAKMIEEAEGDPPVVEKIEPTYPKILAVFAVPLRNGAKRASLRAGGITISLAQNHPGTLYIKHEGEYAGKITPAGKYKRVGDFDAAKLLAEVEVDPKEAAVAYGRATGRCSVCGRELTDPESIARAIGPICLETFSW